MLRCTISSSFSSMLSLHFLDSAVQAGPFCGRRVRSRQTSAPNPKPFQATSAESPGIRSFRRRVVYAVHTTNPADPLCNRAEILDPIQPPPSPNKKKISNSLLTKTKTEARSKGSSKELINAIVGMKRRNPSWGYPRIAQQVSLAFGVSIDKDIVR